MEKYLQVQSAGRTEIFQCTKDANSLRELIYNITVLERGSKHIEL